MTSINLHYKAGFDSYLTPYVDCLIVKPGQMQAEQKGPVWQRWRSWDLHSGFLQALH